MVEIHFTHVVEFIVVSELFQLFIFCNLYYWKIWQILMFLESRIFY